MFSKHDLRTSLVRILLMLAVGPLLVLSLVMSWHTFSVQKAQAIQFQLEVSKRIASEITAPISDIESDLYAAADVYLITQLPYEGQQRVLNRLLARSKQNEMRILDSLTLVAPSGQELNKVSSSDVFTADDFKNVVNNSLFTSALQSQKVQFSSVHIDEDTQEPHMRMALPWFDRRNNDLAAILIADLRLKSLWSNVLKSEVGDKGHAYILDDLGRVIAHQNPSHVLRGALLSEFEEIGFRENLEGEYALFTQIEIPLQNKRFHLITEVPLIEVLGLMFQNLQVMVFMLFFALLATWGLGLSMMKRTLKPIESLSSVANSIAEGNLTLRAPVYNNDEISVLARAFNTMTSRLVDTISRLEENIERVDHLAHYDPLTGLANRRLLERTLKQSLSEAQRHKYFGAILFIDLDHFKKVNDSYGHAVGDQLLQMVAERIKSSVRVEDAIARIGGDEFIVILKNIDEALDGASIHAQKTADLLCKVLAEPYLLNNRPCHVSSSIGVTLFPYEQATASDLLKHADTAMYRSKEEGRNNVIFYQPEMQDAVLHRLQMEREINETLTANAFMLYFQPEVNRQGQIIGVESLIRWPSSKTNQGLPEHFIPIAEETGLIVPMGNWVLENACHRFQQWRKQGLHALHYIGVNISYSQFHQPDFVDQVKSVLRKTGMDATSLKLELTEGVLIEDVEGSIMKMEALRALGVKFSLDDFGTGYSSLSYLSRLPLDILKLDRSFVHNLFNLHSDQVIIEMMIAMGKKLNLQIVAEGVETAEELQFLQQKGCDSYQGFLFSRPLAEKDLVFYVGQNALKNQLLPHLKRLESSD